MNIILMTILVACGIVIVVGIIAILIYAVPIETWGCLFVLVMLLCVSYAIASNILG